MALSSLISWYVVKGFGNIRTSHKKCWDVVSCKHAETYIAALWRLVTTSIWVNIGLDNDLLSDVTEPLPEPMLTSP